MSKVILTVILTVFMGISFPVEANSQTKEIIFIVGDSATPQLAEGIKIFRENHPDLREAVRIRVYPANLLAERVDAGEEDIVPEDFISAEIIFLDHLPARVVEAIKDELAVVREKGGKIINQGGVLRLQEHSNVNLTEFPEIPKYWRYRDRENIERLLVYLCVKLLGIKGLTIKPPAEVPRMGIYHPQSPELFPSFEAYLNWYKEQGLFRKNAPFVGVVGYHIMDNMAPEDTLIAELEKKGLNVICGVGYPAGEVLRNYFLQEEEPLVDIIITTSFGHADEATMELLKKMNIPLIRAIVVSNELDEWRKSVQGIPPFSVASQVVLAELMGIIEPTVIGGRERGIDEATGITIVRRVPEKERIEKIASRAKAWIRLRRLRNEEKKVAILYWNHPPGKHNVGSASYLDVAESLKMLLEKLKKSGYVLPEDMAITKDKILELMLLQGRNIGSDSPGELEKIIKEGKAILLPFKKYRQWFKKLPLEFQESVLISWGSIENTRLMVYKDNFVIPGIKMGNIFLAPQPTRGKSEDEQKLYHDLTVPPHHQYIAFYLWLRKEFSADALIHFGKHGTQEWLPGKQVGLSGVCAPDVLIQDLPVIYPYIMDDVGEGLQAKRRGNAVIISHMTPALIQGGIHQELSQLHDLIHLYLGTKEVTPMVAQEYQKQILDISKELGIGQDLGLNLDEVDFDEFLEKLHNYIHEVELQYIPYGLHVLGVPLEGEELVGMTSAMLSVEGELPALPNVVASLLGKDYEKMAENKGKYCEIIDEVWELSTRFITAIVQENTPYEEAAETVFRERYLNASSLNRRLLRQLGETARKYADNLVAVDNELINIIRALNAEYIPPSVGNDPIRAPDALPTGRNFYGFDLRKLPTQAAWRVGKQMAEGLIQSYKEEHGKYPRNIAVILWATEALRHHGVMESKALYLLGVEPLWDGRGELQGVRLISEEELKRPRIDVVVSISGLYRDLFPTQVYLIDQAIQLALNAESLKYENFARLHTLEMVTELKKQGYSEEEAASLSRLRIFGPPLQGYGTGIDDPILDASDTWDDEAKIADLYLNRMSHAYGRDNWGRPAKSAFKENIKRSEMILHARSSNVYGVLDNDDVFQYLGGLAMAARSLTGKTPELYVSNLRDPANPELVDFNRFLGLEMRSRYFNPTWIKGMMKHGYSGAKEMVDFVDYLWGWQVTTPDKVTKEMWQQIYQIYVEDKYDLGMEEFFREESPYALQEILSVMLEVARKGYHEFDPEFLEKIAQAYVESVNTIGLGSGINMPMKEFAADVLKDIVPTDVVRNFEQKIEEATQVEVVMPHRLEEVAGRLMEEVGQEEPGGDSPIPRLLPLFIAIITILTLLGIGLWKGMGKVFTK